MNCPTCNADTYVQSTEGPKRRRKCTKCGYRFTTREVLEEEHRRREALLEDARELAEKLAAEA